MPAPDAAAPGGRAAAAFAALSAALGGARRESLARQFNGCVLFDLGAAGKWTLDLRDAGGAAAGVQKGAPGDAGSEAAKAGVPAPDLTVQLSEDAFMKLINGELEPSGALMAGAGRRARARRAGRAEQQPWGLADSCAALGCLRGAGDLKIRGNMALATKLGPVLRAAGEARAKAKL
jgi:hypothetical protein